MLFFGRVVVGDAILLDNSPPTRSFSRGSHRPQCPELFGVKFFDADERFFCCDFDACGVRVLVVQTSLVGVPFGQLSGKVVLMPVWGTKHARRRADDGCAKICAFGKQLLAPDAGFDACQTTRPSG
jgi:hypothetical protein